MYKIIVIATLLVATVAADSDQKTSGSPTPSTSSTTYRSVQKPAIIGASQEEPHTSIKREDNPKPAPPALPSSTSKPLNGQQPTTDKNTEFPKSAAAGAAACPANYDPVCGSDRKTYSNLCAFGLAQQTNPAIIVVKKGEC